ncbi:MULTISPECIES: hypothetical protein [Neptunomonas]|uniref:Uncharacterized protein n=1 Tax=Neptunomonas marina TaxID=1815562 RepID=A0A437QDZ6_9GAMM|nr:MULTISPECIES: hypothetical protein [Neptunomonas]RVU32757.1 hypothetical protein EOE65_03615 [Neptunomonas marina]
MASKIRDFEDWVDVQEALLDTYVEKVFEAKNIDDWFSAAHWYMDAVMTTYADQSRQLFQSAA